ncbi:MAG: T9SS type A sorting domain-containing protein [Bacteroidia bacterium]
MKLKITLFAVFSFIAIGSFSQTGPAGVGTNTASVNQDRFWLKADVGVFNDAGVTAAVNGNKVQQWNDQSGVGNNSTQVTAAYKPTYVTNAVNGLPALRFNGSNFVTAGAFPAIANNVGYSYLIVFKDTSFSAAGTMTDGSGDYIIDRGLPGAEANELASLKITSSSKYGFQKRDGGGGGLGGPASVTSVNTTNYHIIDYRQTPGATKVYDLYLDGAFEATVSSADANYVPPVPQIGHHYQPVSASGMKGYIAEVILYNYNINNAQLYILNSYLAAKYGLTLTSNDKYVGDNAANGDYDFEVAGVGREVGAAAVNTQASSSISGGLDMLSTSGFEDNDYIVYGHQSGNNSFNTADISGMSAATGTGAVGRWNRIWYLDFTDASTPATVTLTFDMSDGSMSSAVPAPPLSNYKLLFRAGLAGAWTEVQNANSIAGDRISFTGVAFTAGRNDGYYTIGTLDNSISPLPIELLSFDAKPCNKEVCLDWSTATERNNDYFIVERAQDGINFETVGQVKGAGSSTSVLNYSLVDNAPYKGVSYYRLKQTDFNGAFTYSEIKQVEMTVANDFSFNVFPNPGNGDVLNVSFNTEKNEEVLVVVYDAAGRETYSKIIVSIDDGNNVFAIDPSGKLAPGIYFITATSQQNIYNKKLIVK